MEWLILWFGCEFVRKILTFSRKSLPVLSRKISFRYELLEETIYVGKKFVFFFAQYFSSLLNSQTHTKLSLSNWLKLLCMFLVIITLMYLAAKHTMRFKPLNSAHSLLLRKIFLFQMDWRLFHFSLLHEAKLFSLSFALVSDLSGKVYNYFFVFLLKPEN